MLYYLYAKELAQLPKLQKTMHQDRAKYFREHLGWNVTVDENGFELDKYDQLNPLYAIWRTPDGKHGGSMRMLPTIGACAINDYYSGITGAKIQDPLIWEFSRLCINPNVGPRAGQVVAALMLAGCEIGRRFKLSYSIGIFDHKIEKIYNSIGLEPQIIAKKSTGNQQVSFGFFGFSSEMRNHLCEQANIIPAQSYLWVQRAFGFPLRTIRTG